MAGKKHKLDTLEQPPKKSKLDKVEEANNRFEQTSETSIQTTIVSTHDRLCALRKSALHDESPFGKLPLPVRAEILKLLSDDEIVVLTQVSRIFYNWIHTVNPTGTTPEPNNLSFYSNAISRAKNVIKEIIDLLEFHFSFERENEDLWFKGIDRSLIEELNIFHQFIIHSLKLMHAKKGVNYHFELIGSFENKTSPSAQNMAKVIELLDKILLKNSKEELPLLNSLSPDERVNGLRSILIQGPQYNPNFVKALKKLSPIIVYLLPVLTPTSHLSDYMKILQEMCEGESLSIMRWLYFNSMAVDSITVDDSKIKDLWKNKISPTLDPKQQDILVNIFKKPAEELWFPLSDMVRLAKSLQSKELPKLIKFFTKIYPNEKHTSLNPFLNTFISMKVSLSMLWKFSNTQIPLPNKKTTNFLQVLFKSQTLLQFLSSRSQSLKLDLLAFAKKYADSIGKVFRMKVNEILMPETAKLFSPERLEPKLLAPQEETYHYVSSETRGGEKTPEKTAVTPIDASQAHVLKPATNTYNNSGSENGNNNNNDNTISKQFRYL